MKTERVTILTQQQHTVICEPNITNDFLVEIGTDNSDIASTPPKLVRVIVIQHQPCQIDTDDRHHLRQMCTDNRDTASSPPNYELNRYQKISVDFKTATNYRKYDHYNS